MTLANLTFSARWAIGLPASDKLEAKNVKVEYLRSISAVQSTRRLKTLDRSYTTG